MSTPRLNQSELRPVDGDWPPHGLERIASCPVCGNSERHLLYDELQDRVFFCAPGKWLLHECLNCGAAFLDPRPTPETTGMAYEKYYTHHSGASGAKKTNWRKRFRRALLHGYVNAKFGYDLTPASAWHRLLYTDAKRRFADRWIRHLKFPGGHPRLLDVGCGNGDFLLQMQKTGWNGSGLDPDPNAVEICRRAGLDVKLGTLREDSYPANYFDAITINHVIEHLHDPVKILGYCHRILRPNGTLWIATPNLNSIGHKMFGLNWLGLDTPRHLVIFTSASLKAALQQIGFQVQPTPPMAISGISIFRSSKAITHRRDPYAKSSLSPIESWWLRQQGRRADRLSAKRPELDEEVVVIAIKQI
jgi:2-polyprenyl-3-methyl-5-hydroxy-6-metoxy-1,4-benzoquinol methylase